MKVYTDGACKGNPGKGGWGAYIVAQDGTEQKLHGGDPKTTNNRMELTAIIEALKSLNANDNVDLYTDSKYAFDGIGKWLIGWKKNGFMSAKKTPVKNQDLWEHIDTLINDGRIPIRFHWVRGHNGNHGNETADHLANEFCRN